MNSTSIYILVALHPIITLTNMPNTAMEATELLKEIQKHDSQQAFRSLYDMYYDRFFRVRSVASIAVLGMFVNVIIGCKATKM